MLPTFPVQSFGMAFIDGAHDAVSTRRDLALVSDLIRPGGTILVHDYNVPASLGFQVKAALDEWLTANPRWRLEGTVEKLAILGSS